MTRTLATSPDGQWAVARDGRTLFLLPAAGGAPLGTIELDSEDVDVALSIEVVGHAVARALDAGAGI